MEIRAIIFDFGQVLNAPVDRTAVRLHHEKMAAKLGIPVAELWPALFTGEAAHRWMTGVLPAEEFWAEVLAPYAITDPEEVAAFADEIFKGSEKIHPEMVSLLSELKEHGYKLAVLSNADWTEAELAADFAGKFGLPGVFDVVITSTSAGVTKPDPAIFHYALKRLGVSAKESIFTDDIASFADAAAELGIHAVTFTTPAEFRRYLQEMGVL